MRKGWTNFNDWTTFCYSLLGVQFTSFQFPKTDYTTTIWGSYYSLLSTVADTSDTYLVSMKCEQWFIQINQHFLCTFCRPKKQIVFWWRRDDIFVVWTGEAARRQVILVLRRSSPNSYHLVSSLLTWEIIDWQWSVAFLAEKSRSIASVSGAYC